MPSRNITFEYEPECYLDSRAFKAYCHLVYSKIPKKGNVTLRAIKEALGDNYRERWQIDSLDALTAEGLIESSWVIQPTRYSRATRPVAILGGYNSSISITSAKKTSPFGVDGARVAA